MTTSLDLKQAQPLGGVFAGFQMTHFSEKQALVATTIITPKECSHPTLLLSQHLYCRRLIWWSGPHFHPEFPEPLVTRPFSGVVLCLAHGLQSWVGDCSLPQCHRRAKPHHALASLTPHDKTVIPFLAFWSLDSEPGFSKRHL